MPRMRILNTIEQEAFETPPLFNSTQRRQYFDVPLSIQRLAASLRTPTNQLCFLLSCGYFQATKQFFPVRTFHPHDIEYVAARVGLSPDAVAIDSYDKQTLARHQQLILKFHAFRAFDQKARAFLAAEIVAMVRSQLKPRLMFWRCVDLLGSVPKVLL